LAYPQTELLDPHEKQILSSVYDISLADVEDEMSDCLEEKPSAR
jgi:hypothetical protein